MKKRRVGVLMVPEFSMITLAAAYEPFRKLKELLDSGQLETILLSINGQSVLDCEGRRHEVDMSIFEDNQPFDILIVIASFNANKYQSPKIDEVLRRNFQHGALVAGADSGPWFLAAAGLLAHKRATIHWSESEAFFTTFPDIQIDTEGYVIHGRVMTCAGGTTMLPAAIEIIDNIWGVSLATTIAHMFNIVDQDAKYTQQQNALIQRLSKLDPSLASAMRVIRDNIHEPISIPDLAIQIGISQRKLNSIFQTHFGKSPQNIYVEERLMIAQRLVKSSQKSVTDIAFACGFSSINSFARSYKLQFGVSASEQRSAMRFILVT